MTFENEEAITEIYRADGGIKFKMRSDVTMSEMMEVSVLFAKMALKEGATEADVMNKFERFDILFEA